ncbi:hypothetical protein GAY33_09530 [Azospirillum brasilense]|uniref:hypothetical protein n=1 Tax=Azospirillum argentinense TaxID=2970906 RepID=UPI00190C390B|nr:hypothetical protein [Azospirillum argentinense]MBK3799464.1 hypothetical protein [Azospirillum argentinense]
MSDLFDLPAPLPVAVNAIHRHKGGEYEHDPHDWYVEEPWCTDVLLDAVPFTGTVIDPSCGSGRIVEACRRRGLDAVGSDLVDRGYPHCTPRIDFTLPGAWPRGSFDNVICNPPYYSGKGSVAFIDAALGVARHRVAALVPLPFLAGQRRNPWFKGLPVSHVLVLSRRPSMPPGKLLGTVAQKGGKEDYTWIVCTHGHVGLPSLDWLMPDAVAGKVRP